MAYIGTSPTQAVRTRFLYTATASQTTFSGADTQNLTLRYSDANFVDVYQNGVLLKGGGADYTATTTTSVVLATGATADDVIEIIVYDVFAVANLIKKDGDTVEGVINFNGKEITLDADFDTSITSDTDDQIDIKIAGADDFQFTANTFTILSGSTLVNSGNAIQSNAGITIDNITIDGTEIDLSSGDLTIDVAGDITLDADGGDIIFKDGGSTFGTLTNNSGTFLVNANTNITTRAGVHTFDNTDGSSEYMRVDSSGRLLLGTSTPSSYSNRMMTVAGNDDATIEIRANPSNGHSQLVFSDGTEADNTSQRGYIVYDHPDENFKFGVYDTEFMRAHSIGAVTFSKQPAFLVFSVDSNNFPINDTRLMTLDTEVFDQNNDVASNVFTAPVTGRYQLSLSLYFQNVVDDAIYLEVYLTTSNRTYYFIIDPEAMLERTSTYHTITASVLADMDASDTASISYRQSSGTATTDFNGTDSFFSGYLAC